MKGERYVQYLRRGEEQYIEDIHETCRYNNKYEIRSRKGAIQEMCRDFCRRRDGATLCHGRTQFEQEASSLFD